jgi:hypothetical protein
MRTASRSALVAICATSVLAISQNPSQAAATSSQILACQKTFESSVRSYSTLASTQLLNCTEKVVECKLASEIDSVDPTSCLAAASTYCEKVPGKLSNARTLKEGKVDTKCVLLSLAELKNFVAGLGFFNVFNNCSNPTATDLSTLVSCVFNGAECALEHEAFVNDPRAQDSLTTAGVDGSFSCVGP